MRVALLTLLSARFIPLQLGSNIADESLKEPRRNGIIAVGRSGEQEREEKERVGEVHDTCDIVSHSDSASSCDKAMDPEVEELSGVSGPLLLSGISMQ